MNGLVLVILSWITMSDVTGDHQRPLPNAHAHSGISFPNGNQDPVQGERYMRDGSRYAVKAVDFNSSGMDFSPRAFKNGIVFVSSRSKKGVVQSSDESVLNLFYTMERENGTFLDPEPLNSARISAYHEGPVAFYENGTKMIFTRNSFVKKSRQKDGSINPLELAQCELADGGAWSEPKAIPLAGTGYSVAHPAMNEAGTALYFSSNMPGTIGQSDIFVSHLRNGEWSKPEHLGVEINTPGQEVFPFVYKDSLLFFASNGRGGLGGLDIFYCRLEGPDRTVYSMDAPLNSSSDDFGIFVEKGGMSGFFSSSREGGAGEDDIYYFEEIQSFVKVQVFDSLTRAFLSGADITLRDGSHARRIAASDLAGKAEFRLSPFGDYELTVIAGGYHPEVVQLKGSSFSQAENVPVRIYLKPLTQRSKQKSLTGVHTRDRSALTNVISFSSGPLDVDVVNESDASAKDSITQDIADSLSAPRFQVIALEVINHLPSVFVVKHDTVHIFEALSESMLGNKSLNLEIEIPQGAQRHVYEEIIRKQINSQGYSISRFLLIRSFFFDSGKKWVRNDACAQLDKIIEVMVNHPGIKLQMTFHSDARGTERFNLELSKERAHEVAAYLAKSGIKSERIITKFVGESQLLNNCGDLADCDELLHQTNRTVEFNFIVR